MNAKKINQGNQPDAFHVAKLLEQTLQQLRNAQAGGNDDAVEPSESESSSDQRAAPRLLDLIESYRRGKQEFADRSPEGRDPPDSLAAETYEPPMEAIRRWTRPAEDHQAALAALRLGLEEVEYGDNETAYPLLMATHAFFRRDLYGVRPADLRREDIWRIDDSITQVDGILCLALRALSILADGLVGNPLIHDVSALERALQLGRERLEFASERLGEVGMGIKP